MPSRVSLFVVPPNMHQPDSPQLRHQIFLIRHAVSIDGREVAHDGFPRARAQLALPRYSGTSGFSLRTRLMTLVEFCCPGGSTNSSRFPSRTKGHLHL